MNALPGKVLFPLVSTIPSQVVHGIGALQFRIPLLDPSSGGSEGCGPKVPIPLPVASEWG
jgi:hypothetical protein